jgi:putative NADPH-quinone reductase
MKKKILVILGHPDADSFCGALFKAYIKGAEANSSEVREIKIGDLTFDPVLWKGYNKIQELEPDLVRSQEDILWAEHIVFVYPTWWGAMPSLMKGFIDRTFLPGFAFKYRNDSQFWDKLLSGRSAQLLVTLDTPPWYYRLIYRSPGYNQMKRTILGFCGIKVNSISEFSPIKGSNQEKREKWLKTAEELGKKA